MYEQESHRRNKKMSHLTSTQENANLSHVRVHQTYTQSALPGAATRGKY